MMHRRNNRHPRHMRRAFTLMEIIVVVTIIAVLAALVAPRLMGRIGWAKENRAESDARAIHTAVEMYVNDMGLSNVDNDFDLDVLLLPPDEGGGSQGPYLKKADDLFDPWANAYAIRVPGVENYDFDIISLGADGEANTDDDIAN